MNKLHLSLTAIRAPRSWRFLRELKFALAALEIGSRTVPLADNRQLVRDLSARAAALYEAD